MFRTISPVEDLPKVDLEAENYSLDDLRKMEEELNEIKNRLNEPYQNHRREYTKFSYIRKTNPIIDQLKQAGFEAITRASLKLIELFIEYILPELPSKEVCAVFENGCFPCAFMKTFSDIYPGIEIYGSSLLPGDHKVLLGDIYGIYKRNPERFFMDSTSPNANGDMTNSKCIIALANILKTCLGDQLKLYVSDASIGVGDNFNEQESLNIRVLLGCVVCALIALPKGSHAIFKFYTMFRTLTVNIVAILAHVFEEVVIVKPNSSGANNSENYLVCKKYEGTSKTILSLLIQKVDQFDESPIIARENLPDNFLDDIKAFFKERCKEQEEEINSNISGFEYYLKDPKEYEKKEYLKHLKFAKDYMKKQRLVGAKPSNRLLLGEWVASKKH